MSAGIFASRLGLSTLLLERLMPGGQVINAEVIEDYPGFKNPISGAELVGKMQEQAMAVGTEIRLCEVTGISRINNYWRINIKETRSQGRDQTRGSWCFLLRNLRRSIFHRSASVCYWRRRFSSYRGTCSNGVRFKNRRILPGKHLAWPANSTRSSDRGR